VQPTLDEIVSAFLELTEGTGKDLEEHPIKRQIMQHMQAAAPRGLTAPELIELVLGRQLTREEDLRVFLMVEDAAGHS
jgi:hypothetical protein